MNSHNTGLIGPIWRHKTIGSYPVLIYSLRPTHRFISSAVKSKWANEAAIVSLWTS